MSENGMNENEFSNVKSKKKTLFLGIILMLVAASLFGTLGTLTNFAHQAGLSPVAFAMWRELLGTVSMFILLTLGVGRPPKKERIPITQVPGHQIRNICFAAIAFSAYSLAMFYAFVELTVALALLLFYVFPAIVTVICAITGVEKLNSPKLIALLLALGGGTLAVVGQMFGQTVQISTLGIILALGAAVGMSIFYLIGRNGYPNLPPAHATTFFLAAGTLVFVICGVAFGEKSALLQPFHDSSVWFLLIFAGLVGAAIPTMLMLTGIRLIGASRASTLQIFEPVMGAILAAVFLGQQIYSIQIIGGLLILTAAYILQRKSEPIDKVSIPQSEIKIQNIE
ncbi:DMT family transporter [Alteribacillus sp. YIM 98480]|uniref:DMT family transporter n=1 Tax=Alteribacillus sp. YIM 98480 TaxID=2606599 RepID=UPI00131C9B21|nr:DMT family transporter [Alteribacillus sp. YIM 98480]